MAIDDTDKEFARAWATHAKRLEYARRLQASPNADKDMREAGKILLESPLNPDWMLPKPTISDPFKVLRDTHEKFSALLRDRGIDVLPLMSELQSMYHDEIILARSVRDGLDDDESPQLRRRLLVLLAVWGMRTNVLKRLQREYLTSFEILPLSDSDIYQLTERPAIDIPQDIFSGQESLRRNAEKLFDEYCRAITRVTRMKDLKGLYAQEGELLGSESAVAMLQRHFSKNDLGAGLGYEPGNPESFMKLVEEGLKQGISPGL